MGDVIKTPAKKSFKDKWEDFKTDVKVKAHIAYDWCREHKELLMVVVPAVIGAVGEVSKAAIKAKDHREERELEERKLCTEWDPSLGSYVDTKRPLTTEEKREIQRIKREKGITKIEALDELGLLDI